MALAFGTLDVSGETFGGSVAINDLSAFSKPELEDAFAELTSSPECRVGFGVQEFVAVFDDFHGIRMLTVAVSDAGTGEVLIPGRTLRPMLVRNTPLNGWGSSRWRGAEARRAYPGPEWFGIRRAGRGSIRS